MSRAALLGSGLTAAVGLAGCGERAMRFAPAPPGPSDDAAIGRVLAGTALLSAGFFERAAAVAGFAPGEAALLRAAAADERAHHRAIARAMGPGVPSRLRFAFPAGTFAGTGDALRTGVALQRSALGSYLGAVSELRSPAARSLVARIATNEAQHLQDLMFLRAPAPGASASIPAVLTPREAAGAVAPYLA